MAGPVSGEWARQNIQPYAGRVWGTGINPVHAYYGSDPVRIGNLSQRQGEITPPYQGVSDQLIPHDLWGYSLEDSLYTGVHYDDRPTWGQTPPEFRGNSGDQPSWDSPGRVVSAFRAMKDGAYRTWRNRTRTLSPVQYQVPSETVSEGWLNKPHGQPADSIPSDPSQLVVRTSQTQRYKTRTNAAAVTRNTDAPRAGIASLVVGQHTPVYSGGERHYDMQRKDQDSIPRAFWYRTAGTGDPGNMIPNTMYTVNPIQRIPPPEPSQGTPETAVGSQYGYTDEDPFYA